mmetsp:Transcript_1917/g.3144  ORF Transcript_1917/g.3144 Transcript_1917/m.3144 type:complete len:263 (-) Transcript_1917:630-1418(-)
MHSVASKVSEVSGTLAPSQQKVSCSLQCETSSSFRERSQPIVTTPGLTPKYLPSPLPTSASRVPTGRASRYSFTRCQYTLRLPRVWFQWMAILSYTRTTWSNSSSPGFNSLAGSAPGFNACRKVRLTLLPLGTTAPSILSLRRGVIACDHLNLASPDRINKLRAGKCSSLRTGAGGEVASLGASAGSFLVSVMTMSLSKLRMKISGPKQVSVSVWELMPWPGRYSLIVSWLMGRMLSLLLLVGAESVLALSSALLVTAVNAG